MTSHGCPHRGGWSERNPFAGGLRCGECGCLCDRCKEDRADLRTAVQLIVLRSMKNPPTEAGFELLNTFLRPILAAVQPKPEKETEDGHHD